jgi:hypothetical protein
LLVDARFLFQSRYQLHFVHAQTSYIAFSDKVFGGLIASIYRHFGKALQAQNRLPAFFPFLAVRFTMADPHLGHTFSPAADF